RVGYAIRQDEGHSITGYGGESDYQFLDMNFKAQYRHDFQGMVAPVSLTTGIDLVNGSNELQRISAGRFSEAKQDIDKFVYAPFAQLEVMATDRLTATLGLRYENVEYDAKDLSDPTKSNERVFKKFSPKLGLSYDLTDDHMMFAGVSKGFAPPSRNQIFTDTYSNPGLAAEVATNVEMGIRGAFAEQNLSYDIGLYYMNVEDYISNEYVETVQEFSRGRLQNVDKFRPVNAGKVNFRGLEAQIEYEPVDYLRFAVSYTYARNKFVDFIDDEGGADEKDLSGHYLASSPKHHINTRVTLIPMTDLEIELEMDSYSGSYTNSDNDLDSQGRFNQADIFNLRVNYETGPVELWLTALNITDKKYATGVSYRSSRSYSVGDGRSIYTGVAYNF
ncbi:MAG: TonB-dependent receptor, partial [Gammaproteobacteria bacterium]